MRNLEFDPAAFEDLAWWIEQDRKQALRIVKLIEATQRTPFEGPGQPEPLRHELAAGHGALTVNTVSSIKSLTTKSESWPVAITTEVASSSPHYSNHPIKKLQGLPTSADTSRETICAITLREERHAARQTGHNW